MNSTYKKWLPSFSLVALSVIGCGKLPKSEGFVSESNICRPIKPDNYDPTDVLRGKVTIPAPQTGIVKTAQLTAAETSQKYVWGVEFFLSSLSDSNAQLSVSTLVKRSTPEPSDILTMGPDSDAAYQVLLGSSNSQSVSTIPAWVQTRFPGVISLSGGDAIWLITVPDSSTGQDILWWYTTGDGIYATAPAAPVYGKIGGISTLYRLIYCE
jgi:hypothetical protein